MYVFLTQSLSWVPNLKSPIFSHCFPCKQLRDIQKLTYQKFWSILNPPPPVLACLFQHSKYTNLILRQKFYKLYVISPPVIPSFSHKTPIQICSKSGKFCHLHYCFFNLSHHFLLFWLTQYLLISSCCWNFFHSLLSINNQWSALHINYITMSPIKFPLFPTIFRIKLSFPNKA